MDKETEDTTTITFDLLGDEDDDLLMQAEDSTLDEETAGDCQGTADNYHETADNYPEMAGSFPDFDGNNLNTDEGIEDCEAANISLGLDSAAVDEGTNNVSGFDFSAGKLWIYPTNIPVRDYQYNIVQQALFKNTLVVLPTGLGKTFIAAVVMYNFYRWFPQGKIVFMAPTKPLVAQQILACYNIMGIPKSDTVEMTGTMHPPVRLKAWKEKRVMFLTPQVMTNDLSRGSVSAESLKCLVLDEAHKALGNHAYCQVVRQLVQFNREFRILALSATPGSDLKAVQQVMSNLLISHIELRSEESIDICRYTHERKIDKIVVPLGEELSAVRLQYIQILNSVIQKLTRARVMYNREATKLSKFLLLKARDEFRQNPPQNLQQAQTGNIEADFAMAISLYHGFELLQLHGLRPLYNFLTGIVVGEKGYGRTRSELLRNGNFNDIMETLRQKFTESGPSVGDNKVVVGHPKMHRLEEIVVNHFKQFDKNGEQTRVMIFSQYRDSVQEIASVLNQHKPLVKVMPFIGQSSAGKATKGYTQKEQLLVMKQFREGGYNTLVSTCVGEEGLDIGDVDLIICFDAHKSPIRLVQRMGRTGRKRQGRVVMLVTEGKEEQIYNQSLYSKKSIHKAILNGAKQLQFYPSNPRMVPTSVTPICHKMHITLAPEVSKKGRKSGKKNHSMLDEKRRKISSIFDKQGTKVSEEEPLTETECEEMSHEMADMKLGVKLIPRPQCLSLTLQRQRGKLPDFSQENSKNLTTFAEWMPWQNSLQTSRLVGHSLQSQNLVKTADFIALQQCIGIDEDHYGLEMSRILNEEKSSCNRDNSQRQSNIRSFLANAPETSAAASSDNNNISEIRGEHVVTGAAKARKVLKKRDIKSRRKDKIVSEQAESILIESDSSEKFPAANSSNLGDSKIDECRKGHSAKTDKTEKRKTYKGKTNRKEQSKKRKRTKTSESFYLTCMDDDDDFEGEHSKLTHEGVETCSTALEEVEHEVVVECESKTNSVRNQAVIFTEKRCHGETNAVHDDTSSMDIKADGADSDVLIDEDFIEDNGNSLQLIESSSPTKPIISAAPAKCQIKELFQNLTTGRDFMELDLEDLIEEWSSSEKKTCQGYVNHVTALLAAESRPDTAESESTREKYRQKIGTSSEDMITRNLASIEQTAICTVPVDIRASNSNPVSSSESSFNRSTNPSTSLCSKSSKEDVPDKCTSPLFKQVLNTTSKVDHSLTSTTKSTENLYMENEDSCQEILETNSEIFGAHLAGNFVNHVKKLSFSKEKMIEPLIKSGCPASDRNIFPLKQSSPVKPAKPAKQVRSAGRLVNSPLKPVSTVKPVSPVKFNESLVTFSQALECLQMSSSEELVETVNVPIQGLLPMPFTSPENLTKISFLKPEEQTHPYKDELTADTLKAASSPSGKQTLSLKKDPVYKEADLSKTPEEGTKISWLKKDNVPKTPTSAGKLRISELETPQFDLGFDLDDDDVIPPTPPKDCSQESVLGLKSLIGRNASQETSSCSSATSARFCKGAERSSREMPIIGLATMFNRANVATVRPQLRPERSDIRTMSQANNFNWPPADCNFTFTEKLKPVSNSEQNAGHEVFTPKETSQSETQSVILIGEAKTMQQAHPVESDGEMLRFNHVSLSENAEMLRFNHVSLSENAEMLRFNHVSLSENAEMLRFNHVSLSENAEMLRSNHVSLSENAEMFEVFAENNSPVLLKKQKLPFDSYSSTEKEDDFNDRSAKPFDKKKRLSEKLCGKNVSVASPAGLEQGRRKHLFKNHQILDVEVADYGSDFNTHQLNTNKVLNSSSELLNNSSFPGKSVFPSSPNRKGVEVSARQSYTRHAMPLSPSQQSIRNLTNELILVNASTPICGVSTPERRTPFTDIQSLKLQVTGQLNVNDLTPIKADSQHDHDDSFIIRRRPRKKVLEISSDQGEEVTTVRSPDSWEEETAHKHLDLRVEVKGGRSAHSKKKPHSLIDADFSLGEHEDMADFQDVNRAKEVVPKMQKLKRTNNKKTHSGTDFIEKEAEVTGELVSSDEPEDMDDFYECSFIDNNTEVTQTQSTDMRAIYLKSIKSPLAGGHGNRYKLKYNTSGQSNVFSQAPGEDEGMSEYEHDSFCVGSGEEDIVYMEEESQFSRPKPKKIRRAKLQKDKKRIQMLDSSGDEDGNHGSTQLTQEFSIHPCKFGRKVLMSSSEDEGESAESSRSVSQNTLNETRKSDQKMLNSKIESQVSPRRETVSEGRSSARVDGNTSEDACRSSTALGNFELLDESDWLEEIETHTKVDGDKKLCKTGTFVTNNPVTGNRMLSLKSTSTSIFGKDKHEISHEVNCSNSSSDRYFQRQEDQSNSHLHLSTVILPCSTPTTVSPSQDCLEASHFSGNLSKPLPVMTREERLRRQKEKQELYKQKLQRVSQLVGSTATTPVEKTRPHGCTESQLKENVLDCNIDTSSVKHPEFSNHSPYEAHPAFRSIPANEDTSPNFTKIVDRNRSSHPLQILIDTKEISSAQEVISGLRLQHGLTVVTRQLSCCDYILSNCLAADRVHWACLSNNIQRNKLVSRMAEMQSLYERCILIIESDKLKPGTNKPKKPFHRTKFMDATLSFLLQTKVRLYFTDNVEETTNLLADLCHIEDRKGRSLDFPAQLNSVREEVCSFLLSTSQVTVPQALNLAHRFHSVIELMASPVGLIQERGCMSQQTAQNLYTFLRSQFDPQMIPGVRGHKT